MTVFFALLNCFKSIFRLRTWLTFTVTLVAVFLLTTPSAFAYGVNECAGSRFTSNLVCTAGDVSITGIAVAPGTPTSCVGGTTFTADLDITVNFATPDRWDIGIFLSNDGKDPQLLPVSGGADSCSVGILPNSSPFFDLDPNGGLDTCGDGNNTINGGTGSGIVRLSSVPVSCTSIAGSGGNLYIPFVVSWDNQSSPSGSDCTSILDPVPNTKSKCNAPSGKITDVHLGTVNAVILPDITKTDGVTTVNPGDTLNYTVVITNTTGQPLSDAVFTDPATSNLTVNSVICSAADGASCPTTTIAAMQGAGITIPDMPEGSSVTFTIGATVANPVTPSYSNTITNTANVTVQGETNSATDVDDINGAIYSDLSTSTKTVVDINGGEADTGDVLRYTITLTETVGLAVTGASVTDDIPPYVNNFTVVSIPTGATDNSTGTGSNNTGYLNITGIDVPANGSETIVFDVTISAGTPAGTTIDNFATVSNPGGPGGTPTAPTITVSPSAVPLTDNKKLYLYSTAPNTISRIQPAATPASISFTNAAPVIWNGNNPVPLQLDNIISSAYATLFLTATTTQTRQVEARMYCSSNSLAYATSGLYDLGALPLITPAQYTFNLTTLINGFTFPATCTAPNYWVLRVDSGTNKPIIVHAVSGVENSRLNLDSSNVIYVESLEFYDAAYPAGTSIATVTPGSTIYIRSVISDPFGNFDISSATVDITDPDGTPVVTAGNMNELPPEITASTKSFQYTYTVPIGATAGNWNVTVTANEGKEGTVTDDHISAFTVAAPNLSFLKLSVIERDPVNDTTNPAAIPGADIRYTLQVSNTGSGTADSNSLIIIDPIPANTKLFVGDLGQGSPVLFSDTDTDSGLTPPQPFTLSYSNQSDCTTYSYSPSADADGFDANVCRLRVQMSGTLSGATTGVTPDFDLSFRTRIE